MEYRVKEIRKERGLTQVQLSKKSGVSRAIIWGLERGDAVTTTKTLVKLADALGVKVDDLFLPVHAK